MSKVVSFVQIVPTISQKTHLYCKYCLCRIDRALEIGEKSYGYEIQMGNSKLILCYDCLSALLPNKSFNRIDVLHDFEVKRLIKLIRKFNSDSNYNPKGFGNNNAAFEDFEYLRYKYQTEYTEEMNKLELNKQENKDSEDKKWKGDDIPPLRKSSLRSTYNREGIINSYIVVEEENTPIVDLDDEFPDQIDTNNLSAEELEAEVLAAEELELNEILRQDGRSTEENELEEATNRLIFANPTYSSTSYPWRSEPSTYGTISSSYYIPLDGQRG